MYIPLKRTIETLKLNIVRLMNDTDLTYPLVDRMQIRDEALVTGRFLRLIVGGEREPGLQKLDAIADLFGVSTASLLQVDSYEVSSEEFDGALKEIIKTYSQATPEGKQAIECTAKIAPRKTKPRVSHKKPKRTQ
jgi:hypothetical protein